MLVHVLKPLLPIAFLPFAVVLPQSSPYQFCGTAANGTPFIQASGGIWEIKV